jgi:capsule biosynthesis phosphatase
MGKPWGGRGGFYVDDKAIRPDEFLRLSYEEILALVGED